MLVAHTHTFWLAPPPAEDVDVDFYVDFQRCQRVLLSDLIMAGRRAAMTHDARVYLIRRELYYRYRWLVPLDSVYKLEQVRISADSNFVGPRPTWAPAPD